MSRDYRVDRLFRRRLTTFFKYSSTPISSACLSNSPSATVAAPSSSCQKKRKSIVSRIHCLDPESIATSTPLRQSLNGWRRRRFNRRDDHLWLTKNAQTPADTSEDIYRYPSRSVKGSLQDKTVNVQSDLDELTKCLCKVTKLDGKDIPSTVWMRFYVSVKNGFIQFILDSNDCHRCENESSVQPCSRDMTLPGRCFFLPLQGLQWSLLPSAPFATLAPIPRPYPSPLEMVESEANAVSDPQCYFFEHRDAGGTQATVIFPDKQTASSMLTLCRSYGGMHKEDNATDGSKLSYSLSTRTQAVNHTSSNGSGGALRRTRKSLPDSATRRRVAADSGLLKRKNIRDKWNGDLPTATVAQKSAGIDDASSADGASKFRFFSSTAAPFFRGIANALTNARTAPNLTLSLPPSPKELANRITAVLGEPPDFSDLNNPGPVFGTPLDNQIPSPDYPNVPLVLHAAVMALEYYGLHYVGLYRTPGRQKEINRFVCLANLTSLDPSVMLRLDVWKDVRALTGVVKVFLRRLPEPIFDSVSWEPLASIVPEGSTEWTKTSLAYTLLAILVKLDKIRTSFAPLNTSHDITRTEDGKLPASWRLATLEFLFSHLRRLVALEAANQCSFECIAICFGPALFGGDSSLQPKLNKILEVMLQHWTWLLMNVEKATAADRTSSPRHPTLAQTETYVEHFFSTNTNPGEESSSLSTSKVALVLETAKMETDYSKDLTEDVLTAVRDVFARAGYSVEPTSKCEYLDSIAKSYDDESLLDVVMRSVYTSSAFENSPVFGDCNAGGVPNRGCEPENDTTSFPSPIQRTNF